jgi:hypothetical protein
VDNHCISIFVQTLNTQAYILDARQTNAASVHRIVTDLGNAQLFLFPCCKLLLGMLAKQLSHLVPEREDRLMAMLDMKFQYQDSLSKFVVLRQFCMENQVHYLY